MFGTHNTEAKLDGQRHPDTGAIRRLAAFRHLDDARLRQIGAAALLEAVPQGAWQPGAPGEDKVFLGRGTLQLEREGHTAQRVSDSQPASVYPLPADERIRISAVTPCELIRVPARFMVLAQNGGSRNLQQDHGIECREGDIEDQLYLDFYQQLKAGKCELPSMPDLARRIGEVIDDPSTASEHIARVIQTDPALAARVMSVVNSAAYNTGRPITKLSQAVSRLGREQIRNLVYSFIIKGIFETDSALLKQRMQTLWAHSCHVAAIAALLARHTPGLDSERALLAGLIHDIGVVPVLDQARHQPELLENPSLLERVIDELRGEIGALTMRQWGFGQDMIDIAAQAEDWSRQGTVIPDYLDVVLLAQMHAFIGTPRMAELPRIDQLPAFHKVVGGELTPRGSLHVIEAAKSEIDELRRLLEAP